MEEKEPWEQHEGETEDVEEDYAMLAGLVREETAKEPVLVSVRQRLPWLLLLFFLGLIVSAIVGLFERVVAHLSVIVSFQSLILGMAGNVGTQSLAVTIRSLANEAMTGRKTARFILKEARVALCNGVLLGMLSFLLVGLYLCFLRGEGAALSFSVALCTGTALAVSMLLSGVSGAVIPLFLSRIGVDPAVASGPFITTVNDLVAVIAYYGLALLLLLH